MKDFLKKLIEYLEKSVERKKEEIKCYPDTRLTELDRFEENLLTTLENFRDDL